MAITLNGDTGITTPTYNGSTTAEYLVPVTSFKNRLINGNMTISQRNGTSAVTIDGGASYTLDRYLCQDNTDGSYTVAQSSTAPTGFINSLLVTITGTDSSLTTTQFGRIVQRIEGLNIADLGWGTASAKTVTLSFWVRSSVTGTFSGTLVNDSGNRVYAFTYTINSANTFEYKTITIAGDTSGTWLTTNGTGIELNLSIGAGPDRTVAAGSWGTSLAYAATGQTNLFATNGATFYLTGCQLEVGSTATSFDYRPYTTELQLCQRYYQQTGGNGAPFGNASAYSSTFAIANIFFPVTMRTKPTGISTTGSFAMFTNNTSYAISSLTYDDASTAGVRLVLNGTSLPSTGSFDFRASGTATIGFTGAEL